MEATVKAPMESEAIVESESMINTSVEFAIKRGAVETGSHTVVETSRHSAAVKAIRRVAMKSRATAAESGSQRVARSDAVSKSAAPADNSQGSCERSARAEPRTSH